jgi:hypothetical protein
MATMGEAKQTEEQRNLTDEDWAEIRVKLDEVNAPKELRGGFSSFRPSEEAQRWLDKHPHARLGKKGRVIPDGRFEKAATLEELRLGSSDELRSNPPRPHRSKRSNRANI